MLNFSPLKNVISKGIKVKRGNKMESTKYFIKFKEYWKTAIEKQRRKGQWNPNCMTIGINNYIKYENTNPSVKG